MGAPGKLAAGQILKDRSRRGATAGAPQREAVAAHA
jgi:hypothetical protein